MAGPAESTVFAQSNRSTSVEHATARGLTQELRCSTTCKPGARRNLSGFERLASLGIGASLLLAGKNRDTLARIGLLGLGAALIHRGATGHCYGYQLLGMNTASRKDGAVLAPNEGAQLERCITIQRSPAELYAFWRDLKNLPQVMRHLKEVQVRNERTSHWVAEGPGGMALEWDAEIFNDRENEMIAWRSLPGAAVDSAGSIHFHALDHDRGTEVRLVMRYNPPAGKIGAKLADFLGVGLESRIDADLQRFKSLMETGEIATTAGQPRGAA